MTADRDPFLSHRSRNAGDAVSFPARFRHGLDVVRHGLCWVCASRFLSFSPSFSQLSNRYALATLLVEPISHLFGRFSIASEHRSPLPALFSSGAVGYSPSKGKHLSIILSGFFHCVYFLFAACAPRYWGVLIAFFIGGIGKSILISKHPRHLPSATPYTCIP